MKFARILSRRSAPERQVIAYLRGDAACGPMSGTTDAGAALSRLAELARQRDVVLFAPGSPFVSDGEVGLISRLATAQRSDIPMAAGIDTREYDSLLHCALLLRDAGLWLPLHGPGRGLRQRPSGAAAALERALEPQAPSDVRARALSLARSRYVASTSEFAAAGVSRQYVSLLCKDGFLQRVRYGWYRAVPAEERGARAARHRI